MEVRIQAIHFEISERLTAFINKKAERLTRHNPSIAVFDTTLKVIKPETAMNKEATIKITAPQHDDLVASKTADSFEEAVDSAIEALERQLEKRKERR